MSEWTQERRDELRALAEAVIERQRSPDPSGYTEARAAYELAFDAPDLLSLLDEVERERKWKALYEGSPEGAVGIVAARALAADSLQPVVAAWKARVAAIEKERDAALESVPQWIAVAPETMPPVTLHEHRILALWMEGEAVRIGLAFWIAPEVADEEAWQTEDGYPARAGWYECAWHSDEEWWLGDGVLFWQPLPAPPVLP